MTAGRFTAPRIAIGTCLAFLATVIAWSCAGSLEDVDQYRLGASTLRSCFGDKNPPKFLTSSRCTQCHLGRDNGIGAALDLTSPDLGKRLSKLTGSCPEELILDPHDPESSTMYRYLNDEIDGCTYPKMPPSGAGISTSDKHCLLTWIDGLDNVDDLGSQDDGAPTDGGPDGGDSPGGDGDGMPGDAMGDGDGMAAPALVDVQRDIFDPICSQCHTGATPPANLNLGPGLPIATLRANIINKDPFEAATDFLVTPGDPVHSYLLIKVKGLQDTAPGCSPGACGVQMPRNLPPLTPTQIAEIEDWIAAGAL